MQWHRCTDTHTLPLAVQYRTCDFDAVVCVYTPGCQRCHQHDTHYAAAVLCVLPCGCQALQLEMLYKCMCLPWLQHFYKLCTSIHQVIWQMKIPATTIVWNIWWVARSGAGGWWSYLTDSCWCFCVVSMFWLSAVKVSIIWTTFIHQLSCSPSWFNITNVS